METLEIEEPATKRRRIERLLRVKDDVDRYGDGRGTVLGSASLGTKEVAKDVAKDVVASSDLSERLKAFLPQLEAANGLLDESLNLENVDEDEEHIEMNLGLGVLEEKSDEFSSEEDEEGNIFDILLRQTSDPSRADLIEDLSSRKLPVGRPPPPEKSSDDDESADDTSDSDTDEAESENSNSAAPTNSPPSQKRVRDTG